MSLHINYLTEESEYISGASVSFLGFPKDDFLGDLGVYFIHLFMFYFFQPQFFRLRIVFPHDT